MAKLTNDFTWSVSRDKLFRSCRRAYYHQYYGAWGGWESDAPAAVRQLYILKNLKTLPMWAGSIVHETIAEALRRYAHKSAPIRAGELQARARSKLRAGWVEAVNEEWRRSPKKTNLQELYYGNGKSLPAAQTERIKERVYASLAAFADSDTLREILAAPYMNWKPIDQLDSFTLDTLKVWCAVDFAYVDPSGRLRVLDWKTGREDPASLQLQLACYALYALETWHAAPDQLRLEAVFLGEQARIRECTPEPQQLIEVQETILCSAAAMRELLADSARNQACESAFSGCGDARTCGHCPFREVCSCVAGC